ncbi:MAG: hypothetical protein SF053_21540 [Bacteroidia bacterium]|jgi:predicted nicotinamide N-methyase|nr:hypothetical protein [Bacteroidia bacterium]
MEGTSAAVARALDELLMVQPELAPLRLTSLSLEGVVFEVYQPGDPDQLMDQLIAKGPAHEDVQDERIPYWADIWPSALSLARYLARRPELVAGRQVLEIGAGLALPGLMALRCGASVCITDYLPGPVALSRVNGLQHLGTMPDCRQMDWRHPDPALAADVVLASDVAYEARAFEALVGAFQTLIRPGGIGLLSEPGRPVAARLFDLFGQAGFSLHKLIFEEWHHGQPLQIGVYEIRRK